MTDAVLPDNTFITRWQMWGFDEDGLGGDVDLVRSLPRP
jgi:hypothetical protein